MKLNVIIPMAGKGSRFSQYGFSLNKFLLPINHTQESMIHAAVKTLNIPDWCQPQYIFIIQRSAFSQQLKAEMAEFSPTWVFLDGISDGPASTVWHGLDYVSDDAPLLISNSDQILENFDCDNFLKKCQNNSGGVLTYTPPYPLEIGQTDKHSFAQTENNYCLKFSEKIVLSKEALIGLHYFDSKRTYKNAYINMLYLDERAPNKEFYISLLYNAVLRLGGKVIYVPLAENEKFYPTGEPKDYLIYTNKNKFGPEKYELVDNCIFHSDFFSIFLTTAPVNEKSVIYVYPEDDLISPTFKKVGLAIVMSGMEHVAKSTISQFHRGWILGNFFPTLLKTDKIEVGILSHKANEIWPYHIHDYSDEYNYVYSGEMTVNDQFYKTGDGFFIPKGHPAVPQFKTDCLVICVKIPSIPTDKRII